MIVSRGLWSIVTLSGLLMLTTGCQSPPHAVTMFPALPAPVANNAVATITTERGDFLVSFNGLLEGKEWRDTTARAFLLPPGANAWESIDDVPGNHGRLASIAVGSGPYAYVFGGYTVAEDHTEVSLPVVHRFDPVLRTFKRLADMPVPVDDAMAFVWRDRYIFLVSGWHDTANVNLVQRYDIDTDSWVQATAYPGAPVFGHSGGMVGDTMVICGGVKIRTHAERAREFVMNTECFAGTVRENDTRRIDWHVIAPMPGPPRYRMAAAGSVALAGVVFVGGSDNPYNYNGIGYNGSPSSPREEIWLYDTQQSRWRSLGRQGVPSMDHRGLPETKAGFVTVGGMLEGQVVTNRVVHFPMMNPRSSRREH
ncbi:MAG: galactose oxidase [Pseudomonadota bacterium]